MVKNNKLFKVLAIVLAIICIVSITGVVNGADLPINPEAGIESKNPTPGDNSASSKITGLTGNILWIIQAVGIAAGVVIIAYMGIKYITSAPDGKAEIKKQAYVYVLGAAFLILAPTIASLVFKTVNT